MLQPSLRRIVAILTFIIGLTLVSLFKFNDKITQAPLSDSAPNQQISFKLNGTASGPKSMYYYYSASDGVGLMRSVIDFSTPERARQEFEYELQLNQGNIPSDRVMIERGVKLNSKSQGTDHRAVAIFGPKGHQLALLVWTDGRMLNKIDSPSLHHVLELEKAEGFR